MASIYKILAQNLKDRLLSKIILIFQEKSDPLQSLKDGRSTRKAVVGLVGIIFRLSTDFWELDVGRFLATVPQSSGSSEIVSMIEASL